VVLTKPFGLFEAEVNSFPPGLLKSLVEQAQLPGVLGNCHAAGYLRTSFGPHTSESDVDAFVAEFHRIAERTAAKAA
jgi:phosphopentomutase